MRWFLQLSKNYLIYLLFLGVSCLISGSAVAWTSPEVSIRRAPVRLGYEGVEESEPIVAEAVLEPGNILLVGEGAWATVRIAGIRLGLSTGRYTFKPTSDREGMEIKVEKGSFSADFENPDEIVLITTPGAVITGSSFFAVCAVGAMGDLRVACHQGFAKIIPDKANTVTYLMAGEETLLFPDTVHVSTRPVGSLPMTSREREKTGFQPQMAYGQKAGSLAEKQYPYVHSGISNPSENVGPDERIDVFHPRAGEVLTLFDTGVNTRRVRDRIEVKLKISGAVASGPPDRVLMKGRSGRSYAELNGYSFEGNIRVDFGENAIEIIAYRDGRVIGKGLSHFTIMHSKAPRIELYGLDRIQVFRADTLPAAINVRGMMYTDWPDTLKAWVDGRGPYNIRFEDAGTGSVFNTNLPARKYGRVRLELIGRDLEDQETRVEHIIYVKP